MTTFQYPILIDLLKSFKKRQILLSIKGIDEDEYPFEMDDLLVETSWHAHYEYDETLDPAISIEERFKLHRQLEKFLFDIGIADETQGDWFIEVYNYPPEDDEGFWDKLKDDPSDPFYKYKFSRIIPLDELGI